MDKLKSNQNNDRGFRIFFVIFLLVIASAFIFLVYLEPKLNEAKVEPQETVDSNNKTSGDPPINLTNNADSQIQLEDYSDKYLSVKYPKGWRVEKNQEPSLDTKINIVDQNEQSGSISIDILWKDPSLQDVKQITEFFNTKLHSNHELSDIEILQSYERDLYKKDDGSQVKMGIQLTKYFNKTIKNNILSFQMAAPVGNRVFHFVYDTYETEAFANKKFEKMISTLILKEPLFTEERPKPEKYLTSVISQVFGDINDFNNEKSLKSLSFNENTKNVTVKIYGKDNLTKNLVKKSMWLNITETLKLLNKNDQFNNIQFIMLFPLTDIYGNKTYDPVMKISLSKNTRSKVNYDEFIFSNIPKIADSYWESPSFKN
ncbi:hypothetical protein J2TS6_43480 [Paenibacillus albilobatus]|uniref:Uncharacterized protein n=1 Tax=Paenibacillus albilobatus TaxID=2716884 RepID=A0A920CDW5_9BACL|nr:hypothetical protein [Paenibacillus albilobatus]GIO33207.1 hypothetical protein J2TS6_43480 [Paenibacillus albilobatus]